MHCSVWLAEYIQDKWDRDPARGVEAETEGSAVVEEGSESASEGRQSPGRQQNRGSRLGETEGKGLWEELGQGLKLEQGRCTQTWGGVQH